MKTYITDSFEETQRIGENLAKELNGGSILALYGNLGSGKTTFVQGLAKGLGIKAKIISPTFIIIRRYEIKNRRQKMFFHIDLYRIEEMKDLDSLGLDDIVNDPDNIIAIEWPEKVENILPSKKTKIKFEYLENDKRRIEIYD